MVATLTRLFGMHNLALAEDVVQDAFCRALEVWKFRGIPDNPSAWLMATAKRRAIDALRREKTARTFAPEFERMFASEWTLAPTVAEAFTPESLRDDQLRMMFSCCHPRLSEPAQIALILHLACGFSVREIASAFLTGFAATEKRITRAKTVLAQSERLFEIDGAGDFATRLSAVRRALYLLFNEGYHGASPSTAIRTELCREAIRLSELLLDHPLAATAETRALYALMCFGAARLPGRIDADGQLLALDDRGRSRWNRKLIAQGRRQLERAAEPGEFNEYLIEAAIAGVHAAAPTGADTDWAAIVSLYDALLRLRPSPVVALNRAIAVARHEGPERGLEEIAAIPGRERLNDYPFLWAALGDCELRLGRTAAARDHFGAAARLARNPAERRFLERRAATCDADQPATACGPMAPSPITAKP